MKRTIGLFMNTFYEEYGVSVWEGIKKASDEKGYNLICFVGGALNNPYFNNTSRNAIYDLASSKNVDGIIALSVSIGSFIDRDLLHHFYTSFSPIPFVSIGIPFKEFPYVYIDNITGMEDLVTHLIVVHNYKRIAFIRGPEKNADAEARFMAYKNVLTRNNIPIDPHLIFNGSFLVNSGQLAVRHFIDEMKVSFDAMIASNDYVAINAISELQKRGIYVPSDIAVVGFDDINESQYLEHPLTTVNQPSFKLGYKSAEVMFSVLNNEEVTMVQKIPSELVIRNSCGCDNKYSIINFNKQFMKSTNDKIKEKSYIHAIAEILKMEIKNSLLTHEYLQWAEKLFNSLINELKGINPGSFLGVFKNFIKALSLEIPKYTYWHTIISFLFNKIIPALDSSLVQSIEMSDCIFNLSVNALKLIDDIAIVNLKQTIIKANELEMHLYSLKRWLHTVLDAEQLKELIKKEFPLLGVRKCYISVFAGGQSGRSETSQLLIAYENGECINNKIQNPHFESKLILPGRIKNENIRFSPIMLSLCYKNELLGFVLYEIEKKVFVPSTISFATERSLCEILTIELGNSVKSILLFNQVTEQTKYLEKNIDETQEKNYSKTLPEEKLQEYFQQLLLYMDTEKPYTNLDLSLPELAEQLNIPRNVLSYVINKFSRVNFYNFINSYRIREAKQYLKKNTGEKINILDVAFNSGFKSKSTFNKIFKKYTHITPSNYRKKYGKEERGR